MSTSGFAFTSLGEVDPRDALRAMLLQYRVGRAEAPALPVRQHLVLDVLRPGSLESQDMRFGFTNMLFKTEAAVDSYSRAGGYFRLLRLSRH